VVFLVGLWIALEVVGRVSDIVHLERVYTRHDDPVRIYSSHLGDCVRVLESGRAASAAQVVEEYSGVFETSGYYIR
jgi:hypothetical protein